MQYLPILWQIIKLPVQVLFSYSAATTLYTPVTIYAFYNDKLILDACQGDGVVSYCGKDRKGVTIMEPTYQIQP